MRDEFDAGVTDARLDLGEGWYEEMSLDQLVSHLRVAGDYSDSYIAGYLSVIYSR